MPERRIPDVAGLKLPAAVELLDAAGVSYKVEELKPQGVRRIAKGKEEENPAGEGNRPAGDGALRVVRQAQAPEGVLLLSVCSVSE